MITFYMVTVDYSTGSGGGAPTKRYEDKAKAKAEAERLCMKEGRVAYLLEATEAAVPPPAAWSPTTPRPAVPEL